MMIVYMFLFLPIIFVVRGSFNSSRMNLKMEHFTLDWYQTLTQNDSLLEAFGNTLELAVISMILATFIGTLAAFGMYRYKFRGKAVLDSMFYIPIVIPEIVLGISLMIVFSICNLKGGMLTLILAHTTFCIPYVVFNVRASISGLDPSMEEASMDLGMNQVQTFCKITLPMIMPGIMSGAFMAFTLSIDDVIISYFTTGPGCTTLPIAVMDMTKRGITPDVNALSTIIMAVVFIIVVGKEIEWKAMIQKLKIHRQKG